MAYEEMTGAKILVQALIDQGITDVFGYPGGAILPVYDELFQQNQIRHVLVRQEGGAVHGAEGYARSTGKVGVVIVTSGPGSTNAVTGLADALMDSIPIVCFCGQVPTHLIGNDAFQECDTTGITRPCTKHNYLVKSTKDLARTIHEAFYVARSGRPGPVLIDLPKDVSLGLGPYIPPADVVHKTYQPRVEGDRALIEQAVAMMAEAKRPIFYCGGGVINSGPRASELLTQFVNMTGFPVTLADGPRRGASFASAVPRHAWHAWDLRSQPRHARLRSDHRHRLALRRPGDRAAERVRPECQEDPHRCRSVLDQQERAGRYRHRR